jgi:hypothetical protein
VLWPILIYYGEQLDQFDLRLWRISLLVQRFFHLFRIHEVCVAYLGVVYAICVPFIRFVLGVSLQSQDCLLKALTDQWKRFGICIMPSLDSMVAVRAFNICCCCRCGPALCHMVLMAGS